MANKFSSSTFITAAGFLIIVTLLQANGLYVSALPMRTERQTAPVYPPHEQVYNGLNIFMMVARHILQLDTLNNITSCGEIIAQRNNSIKQQTVCSMYNLYLNFIALKTLTSTEEEPTNLSSNQIMVKSVMDSSYIWDKAQDATLEDIYRLCFPYELCKAYELVNSVTNYRDSTDEDSPGNCRTDWMNQMLPEKNCANTEAIDLIIQHAECTENTSQGCRYSCNDCDAYRLLCT